MKFKFVFDTFYKYYSTRQKNNDNVTTLKTYHKSVKWIELSHDLCDMITENVYVSHTDIRVYFYIAPDGHFFSVGLKNTGYLDIHYTCQDHVMKMSVTRELRSSLYDGIELDTETMRTILNEHSHYIGRTEVYSDEFIRYLTLILAEPFCGNSVTSV